MHTELVSIPTDSAPLDGALHMPEGGEPRGAVLLVHGNTMNFYTGAAGFLADRGFEHPIVIGHSNVRRTRSQRRADRLPHALPAR